MWNILEPGWRGWVVISGRGPLTLEVGPGQVGRRTDDVA